MIEKWMGVPKPPRAMTTYKRQYIYKAKPLLLLSNLFGCLPTQRDSLTLALSLDNGCRKDGGESCDLRLEFEYFHTEATPQSWDYCPQRTSNCPKRCVLK